MLKKIIDKSFWFIVVVGIPILAWLTAKNFVTEPRVVAPFLFVSPIFALFLVGMVLGRGSKVKARQAFKDLGPNKQMRDLLAKMEETTGHRGLRLQVFDQESQMPRDAVAGGRPDLWIYHGAWEQLDDAEKEFAIARGFALADRSKKWPIWTALTLLAVYAGCVAGMINLWLIIPGQAIFAVGYFSVMFASMRKEPLEADAKALVWTRNLEAALSYVTASTSKKSFGPFANRDARLANLREAAKKLELV